MRRTTLRVATLALLSMLASACTLRYAQSSFAEPILDDAKTGVALEGGVYPWTGWIAGQRADLAFVAAYQSFDFFTDARTTHVEARLRWFPLQPGLFDPFVGGGLGVYRLERTENDPRCRGITICLSGQSDQRGQATGGTPHVVLGTELRPTGARFGVVLAVAREFGAFDPEWDLSAWRVSGGLVYRAR
jgi:hypothetical protein